MDVYVVAGIGGALVGYVVGQVLSLALRMIVDRHDKRAATRGRSGR